MKRRSLAVLAIIVAVAFVAGAFWRFGDRASQSGTAAQASPSDEFGGPFSLTDQYGARRTDRDFRGKYMLVYFGYMYCPDVCPTALAVEANALDKLGERASRIVPIFITVDPKRDTPDKLKAYLASFDAKPPGARLNFVGLTGTNKEIAEVAKAYRVFYDAHIGANMAGDSAQIAAHPEDDMGYSIDHSSNIYLMSPEGKFVAYYSLGILPDKMAADLMRRTVSPR